MLISKLILQCCWNYQHERLPDVEVECW